MAYRTVLVAVCISTFPTSALAQSEYAQPGFEASLGAFLHGWEPTPTREDFRDALNDDSTSVSTGQGFSGVLEYRRNESFAWSASLNTYGLKAKNDDVKVTMDIVSFTGGGRVYLDFGAFQPWAGFEVGLLHARTDSAGASAETDAVFSGNLGFGTKVYLSRALGLGVSMNTILPFDRIEGEIRPFAVGAAVALVFNP